MPVSSHANSVATVDIITCEVFLSRSSSLWILDKQTISKLIKMTMARSYFFSGIIHHWLLTADLITDCKLGHPLMN